MEEQTNMFTSFISTTPTPTEIDTVQLVNEIIIKRQLECPRIRSLSKLHSVFYSRLFRNVFGYNVPDLIKNATTIEEEVHNLQSIIDTLSLDILSISLSHITGEDVVARNPFAVYNLLEIFKGYLVLVNQRNSHLGSTFSSTTTQSREKAKSLGTIISRSSDTNKSSTGCDQISESSNGEWRVNKIEPKQISRIKHLEGSCPSTSTESLNIEPLDAIYKDVFKQVPRRRVTPVRKRSVLIPRCLKTTPKFSEKKMHSYSSKKRKFATLLPEINAALPGIELSKQTENVIRKQGKDHLKFMTVNLYNMESKKRKAQKQHEDAIVKQRKLLDLAQKEAEDQRRAEEAKIAKANQMKVQKAIRDHGIRKARMKKYYNLYHLRHRRRLSQTSTKEEMLLKNLFQERIDLQKENLNEVNKRMREVEEEEAKSQRLKTEAMSNFYETQFSLLKETTRNKRVNFNLRYQSQQRALEDFKRETRHKIEKEIEEIQDNLERRDDFHFRLTDAERLRNSWK